MVETPVLYITFARPEYASQSFAAIKKAQPKKLYFYSNKARSDRPDEVARNEEVRSYINQIDWDCEVKTWFREEYVDVFTSLWGAIDWVFDNEEKACVIEEDVVASLAFFSYIDQIIDKYEDNDKIWIISGNNATPQYNPSNLSYFPSRWTDIYGWASWRKVWRKVDRKMTYWTDYRQTDDSKKYIGCKIIAWFYKMKGDMLYKKISGYYNPWDMIFCNNMRRNHGYSLIPHANLSKDIGLLGENHDVASASPLSNVDYPYDEFIILNEPLDIVPSSYDYKQFYTYKLKQMITRKIKRIFHLNK